MLTTKLFQLGVLWAVLEKMLGFASDVRRDNHVLDTVVQAGQRCAADVPVPEQRVLVKVQQPSAILCNRRCAEGPDEPRGVVVRRFEGRIARASNSRGWPRAAKVAGTVN